MLPCREGPFPPLPRRLEAHMVNLLSVYTRRLRGQRTAAPPHFWVSHTPPHVRGTKQIPGRVPRCNARAPQNPFRLTFFVLHFLGLF